MGSKKVAKLELVNATEDVPRLVLAYGRMNGGECALVLRPAEGGGVLVHQEPSGKAAVWRAEGGSDAPRIPTEAMASADAVKLIRESRKEPGKQGAISLHGKWNGQLECVDGMPRVTLSRKVASYGTLVISSEGEKGWRWHVAREARWYGPPQQDEGRAGGLLRAIQAGLSRAMGLLGEACSVRDSRRRAAYDTTYAEAHPIKPAREGKDPLEKLKPKAGKGEKKASSSAGADPTEPRRSRGVEKASPAPTPAPAPTPTPARERKPRKKEQPAAKPLSPASSPLPAGASLDSGEVDPVKDKLLMDAFSDGLMKVMRELSAA